MYSATILADSINPDGQRITTWKICIPKFVQGELNTHRKLSRNSGSSRARSVKTMIERALLDPVLPVEWGLEQRGMTAAHQLDEATAREAQAIWLAARDHAIGYAQALEKLGLHHQLVNRLLEPWLFVEVIVTATSIKNFFRQRCAPEAQPEIRRVALEMRDCYERSTPRSLDWGEWHTPLGDPERGPGNQTKPSLHIAAVRCARVSYQDIGLDYKEELDLKLFERLVRNGHWSPLEHIAIADRKGSGNFDGWQQMRSFYLNESGEHDD
jgi:hypothetical protein